VETGEPDDAHRLDARDPGAAAADGISRRVRVGLEPGAVARQGVARDLADLEARATVGQLVSAAARQGSPAVRAARRVLYRLLHPLLEEQTAYARANNRLVTQLVSRLAVLERRASLAVAEPHLPTSSLELDPEGDVGRRKGRYADTFAGRGPVMDVRCGRGELLSALREAGVESFGADSDPNLVAHCRALGLRVDNAGPYAALEGRQDASLGGIFAFHSIERMEPAAVVAFVRASARALRPGGVLVIESSSPAALASLADFYVDLAHVRPYDGRGVATLLGQAGFVNVTTEYLLPSRRRDQLQAALESAVELTDEVRSLVADVADRIYGARAYAVVGARPPA
jgi:SAM-dependent methyltransferase